MTGHLLVTGASGRVGSAVVSACHRQGVAVSAYHHIMKLDSVDWSPVTHVVNCAAVLPGPTVPTPSFWDGNVAFIERMLPHLEGRHVVHFGTTSVFYRVGPYQVSKMLGEALLKENEACFASLAVVNVPSLGVEDLVQELVKRANSGALPTVDRLRFNTCTPEEVARHVVDTYGLGGTSTLTVAECDLFETVQALAHGPIVEGRAIDRRCRVDGWRITNSEARESFEKLFGVG